MKVNQINNFIALPNQNFNKQQNQVVTKELGIDLISAPNYLSFQGRPVSNKILLQNETSKAVQAKIVKLYNILPSGAKLQKPSVLVAGNEKCGVILNKYDDGSFKIKVKDMIEKVEDWDSPKQNQSVITCIFDKNGIMKEGEFLNRVNDNYTKRFCYYTEGESKRRIKTEGMLFRPSHGEDKEVWNRIKDLSVNDAVDDINFKHTLNEYDLSEIFFELTKNRASILK